MTQPIQHIGNTILLVMMDVEEGHEAEFDRWYNEEHLPERMEIPGYVSARRFKLEEGSGVLKFLCIWEMEDASPLESAMYRYTYTQPAERLMTIEEAKQLSGLDQSYDARARERETRRNIWSWQSVEGVLSQTVTEAQVDAVIKTRR